MKSIVKTAVLLSSLVSLGLCFKNYQDSLPNGGGVPHPCKPNYIWQGVGHENLLGGGARNPFGSAFENAGKTWTADLCNADSDGDGKTNGEELGDPNCIWTPGNAAENTVGLSHPGVCEPTDSADCLAKNSWTIDCSEGEDFTCEGLDHPDTVNVTLKIDNTAVPSSETTYICQVFDLPDDKEYHLFATKPEIENAYVMHHTILYGCTSPPLGFDSPRPCGMSTDECSVMLGAWTVGSNGECQEPTNGFSVGKGHFTQVMLEHHWNNPLGETNYYDSSGMTLYLTPNLRANNLGFLMTGQEDLEIPAGETAYTVDGVCPGSCTQSLLKGNINVTSAHLHMHYLGASGQIEHWRDGALVSRWFDESEYSYDYPITNEFNPPIEVRPGDEIRTICTFKSTSRSEVTNFGAATSDEMCYGFMIFYPFEQGPERCVSWAEYDQCQVDASPTLKVSVTLTAMLLLGLKALL